MITLLTGAPVSYLQELLCQWVQWPTTDHPNHPTVRALCTALRSSPVGLVSLAEEVEKEMTQCTTGKQVQVECSVVIMDRHAIVIAVTAVASHSNSLRGR